MNANELLERVLVEVAARGLSAEREQRIHPNRVKVVSKTRLLIKGFHCRLHGLENVRVDKNMHYAMFGVTRASLKKSDFLIVLLRPQDGEEQFLIVPSRVVLKNVPKGTRTKQFYVPIHPPTGRKTWQTPVIDWLRYHNRWEQLVPRHVSQQNASATS